MSRYRKTFREALEEIKLAEVGYLMPRMTPAQLDNIKKVWDKKKASDVTPAVKAMIAKMDVPTQLAIKQAGIKHISDLVEGRMKDIHMMDKEGKSAAEIAKFLKLDVKTVKGILGEQDSAQDMQDTKPPREMKKEDEDKLDQDFLDDVANNTPNEEQFDEEEKKKKDKEDVAPEHDASTGEEKKEDSKEKWKN